MWTFLVGMFGLCMIVLAFLSMYYHGLLPWVIVSAAFFVASNSCMTAGDQRGWLRKRLPRTQDQP